MGLIYARRIKEGLMTIEDVPTRWREEVEKIIANKLEALAKTKTSF